MVEQRLFVKSVQKIKILEPHMGKQMINNMTKSNPSRHKWFRSSSFFDIKIIEKKSDHKENLVFDRGESFRQACAKFWHFEAQNEVNSDLSFDEKQPSWNKIGSIPKFFSKRKQWKLMSWNNQTFHFFLLHVRRFFSAFSKLGHFGALMLK